GLRCAGRGALGGSLVVGDRSHWQAAQVEVEPASCFVRLGPDGCFGVDPGLRRVVPQRHGVVRGGVPAVTRMRVVVVPHAGRTGFGRRAGFAAEVSGATDNEGGDAHVLADSAEYSPG